MPVSSLFVDAPIDSPSRLILKLSSPFNSIPWQRRASTPGETGFMCKLSESESESGKGNAGQRVERLLCGSGCWLDTPFEFWLQASEGEPTKQTKQTIGRVGIRETRETRKARETRETRKANDDNSDSFEACVWLFLHETLAGFVSLGWPAIMVIIIIIMAIVITLALSE